MTMVYAGARDLAGWVPVGTHQFVVLDLDSRTSSIFMHPCIGAISAKKLGGGRTGFVIGAHNVANESGRRRLIVKFFEKADWEATKEFFSKDNVKWYSHDLDAELRKVSYGGHYGELATRILALTTNYIINEREDNIPYVFSNINSNSWAQSLIEVAGAHVEANFGGFDISHGRRIPSIYFRAICPRLGRPHVNA